MPHRKKEPRPSKAGARLGSPGRYTEGLSPGRRACRGSGLNRARCSTECLRGNREIMAATFCNSLIDMLIARRIRMPSQKLLTIETVLRARNDKYFQSVLFVRWANGGNTSGAEVCLQRKGVRHAVAHSCPLGWGFCRPVRWRLLRYHSRLSLTRLRSARSPV
jgi:hypothetical protein